MVKRPSFGFTFIQIESILFLPIIWLNPAASALSTWSGLLFYLLYGKGFAEFFWMLAQGKYSLCPEDNPYNCWMFYKSSVHYYNIVNFFNNFFQDICWNKLRFFSFYCFIDFYCIWNNCNIIIFK